jgi:hypothetical protein
MATGVAISGGVTLWSYHQAQQPTPVPPDSMQAHYGLSPALWGHYVDGFQNLIDQRRTAQLANDARNTVAAVVIGALVGALFVGAHH